LQPKKLGLALVEVRRTAVVETEFVPDTLVVGLVGGRRPDNVREMHK